MYTGKHSEAVSIFYALLEQGHTHPSIRYNLAYALSYLSEFKEAERIFIDRQQRSYTDHSNPISREK